MKSLTIIQRNRALRFVLIALLGGLLAALSGCVPAGPSKAEVLERARALITKSPASPNFKFMSPLKITNEYKRVIDGETWFVYDVRYHVWEKYPLKTHEGEMSGIIRYAYAKRGNSWEVMVRYNPQPGNDF